MCILCEKTNPQASDCGLETESYTNFIGETGEEKVKIPADDPYEILALLRKEEEEEHFVEKAPKDSSFILDNEALSKDLDKEQASLFPEIKKFTLELEQERYIGALK